ncbi:transposase [Acetobacteraceae bacterium H6797]|nr:transposase [Acetobacteraceae bacterium H6797]
MRPLTDLQFHALLPYLLPRSPAGRQIGDLRRRMNAIFHIACTHSPWRELPAEYGKPDTIHRYFRRLTHKGLWQRLLEALAEAGPRHPLREIAHSITRACRRAHRILGLPFLVLIRRLGLHAALNGPPWLLPDPDLSETLHRLPIHPPQSPSRQAQKAHESFLASLRHALRMARGRARLRRSVRLAWA